MGFSKKDNKRQAKDAKKKKPQREGAKSKLQTALEWNHMSKKLLKAYPDRSGSAVKTQMTSTA
eukprot:15433733-Alexandrium_andersonii.AAC.1